MNQNFMGIVGKSQAMQEIFRLIAKIASASCNVLIQGETGTGKELIAQAIHAAGPRRDHPFIAVNCSVLPETLIESELFGHVRGAFSGAICDRLGRIEEADGGTFFLDEIGEISSGIQVKLLRVLQEKAFERVGNNKTRHVDARILAATNRDLKSEIECGRFRLDLWYRLSVVQIYVPPLHEHKEDILPLAEHFLRKFGRFKRISPEATKCLVNYNWPGNVRELGNVLERAGVIGEGEELLLEYLPQEVREAPERTRWLSNPQLEDNWAKRLPDLNLHRLGAILIQEALRRAEGNKTKAAALLGIHRRTLYHHTPTTPLR